MRAAVVHGSQNWTAFMMRRTKEIAPRVSPSRYSMTRKSVSPSRPMMNLDPKKWRKIGFGQYERRKDVP